MGQIKEKGDNCQKADSSLQHYYLNKNFYLIYWTIDIMEFLDVLDIPDWGFMTNKIIS